MDITKVIEYLDLQYDLKQEIAELIGYGQSLDCAIEDWRLHYWYVDGDQLLVFDKRPPENWLKDDWLDDADFWEYTISSYSARGERFFRSEQDNYTFIMAYPEDSSWSYANVLVLRNGKQVT